MNTSGTVWTRVRSRAVFCTLFADQPLTGDGLAFTIHTDGRITGLADGAVLAGRWTWEDGYFCRTASLNGQDLGRDCEIIESNGTRMRYVRDKGRGEASIVSIA